MSRVHLTEVGISLTDHQTTLTAVMSGQLAVLPHNYGPFVIIRVVSVRPAIWLVIYCALHAGRNGLGDSGSIQSRVPDQQRGGKVCIYNRKQ